MSALSISHSQPSGLRPQHSALVERVNRLYHEWTANRFDDDHRARHRVEAAFWRRIGRTILGDPAQNDRRRIILDIACGSGFVLEQLARSVSPYDRFIGVDLSTTSLARVRKTAPRDHRPQTFWVGGGGTRLPLASSSVILVTINAALHHFAEPGEMLAEADRVLMPGGHLAIGFEPNHRYFQSSWMGRAAAGLNRLRWYASLKENRRRIQRILRPQRISLANGDDWAADESVAGQIARRLVEEGLCREELPPAAVLDLVDVHARGKAGARGIDFDRLFSTTLSDYEIERVFTSDYLGASLRVTPMMRRLVDAMGRMIEARSGSLISCLLRKPKETP